MTDVSDGTVNGGPRWILQLEGAAFFVLLTIIYFSMGNPWWLYVALFLVPDLSMLAYLANRRFGSLVYNALHSTLGPLVLTLTGILLYSDVILHICLIWGAHIGFDRMVGFGLKYQTGFRHTHLRRIGH